MSAALAERSLDKDREVYCAAMEEALRLVRDERILPRPSALYATGELMGRMNRVYIKDETENPTGAFKLRGAWVRMSHLSPKEKSLGVVTASAGNHAQGVALTARLLGVHADIFVPASAPECKRQQTKLLGGNMVSLHEIGEGSFDEALSAAEAACQKSGATFIHPYDDEQVILGQGTIGSELAEQLKDKALPGSTGIQENPSQATVFVPVGGGGLAAGIGMALKARYPGCRIIGVQLAGADSAARSWSAGRRVAVAHPDNLADGTAVRMVGRLTHELIQRNVDEFVVVDPADLGRAYEDELIRRSALYGCGGTLDPMAGMPETSAMLARAGALKFAAYDQQANAPWVFVQTGKNIDWRKAETALEAYQSARVDVQRKTLGCGALQAAAPRNWTTVTRPTTLPVDNRI